MSGSVSYKFGKSGYYYDGRPLELIEVHAQSPHGLYVYSLSQSQGTIRDNKNLNNDYKMLAFPIHPNLNFQKT